MKFTDFEPKELIGKTVLIDYKYSKEIARIERITKTGFGVTNSKGLFDFRGWLKGTNSWNMVRCELITEEKASELRKQWALKKEAKAILEEITAKINGLSVDQLRAIKTIIDNG